jgi:tetratricopeptide (TPR) repeat protein
VLSFTFGTASAQRTRAKNKKKQNTEQSAAGILRQAEYFFVEGEKYFLLGDYTKAVAEFQKSLELDPKNDVVYFKLAEIYHRTDQLENAEEAIVKALSAETKNKFYYLLAVDIYTAAGKRSEVADIYISLMKNIPDSDQYLISLAAVYLFQDKLDKALETYEKIENIYGINEQTTFQKQKIYLKQNNVEKAIEEGKKLIEAYPKMPKYVILLGEILSSNSRTTEAVLLLQDLTKHNPEVSEARLVLADIFLKERDYDHFSSELELAFKDPELNINAKINTLMKYMAYLPNVQLQSVIPGLVEVLTTTHPDDPNSHLLSGDIYATFLEQNLVDEERIDAVRKKAIESYTIYLQEDPSKFAVWQNLLNLELQTENQDSLAIHADRALELFPNQAWLYLVNGVAFLQQGNDAQAVRMFEMGKKRSANNIGLTVLFNAYLGDTYQGLGEHVKSDAAYEAALKLDPNNYIVLNNYSYYLSLRQEKLDQAKKMATRLIRNNPDNDTYLDTYAWVHYALGNYEEAKRVLEKVVVGDEPHAEYFNHYGDVLYQLGFRNEAVIQWKKARELDNNLENIDQKIAERKVIQ